MKKNWLQMLLALGAIGVGLIVALVVGLNVFMSMTAKPLHPVLQEIPTSTDAPPPQRFAEAVEAGRQIVRAALTEQNLPGLSVAVGVGDDLVWAEGFGWADLDNKRRVAPDTMFRIGTASMVLTSVAAGLLLESGDLELDAPIQLYVPAYPEKEWPVTVRQLMGHVAGVRNDFGDEGPLGDHCARTIDGLRLFEEYDLLFEPQTRYRFSSFGWILVSAAIEAAARESFLSFMRDRVFAPLGMNDTRADSPEQLGGRAMSYFPRYSADPRYGLHPTRRIDHSCYAGASAFISTPSDLVRFGLAVNGDRLLRRETRERLQTSGRLTSGEETGYGLGWDIETVELDGAPARWVGHDGLSMGGNVAALITFPDRGLAIAVTSNIAWADTEAIAVDIAQKFARVTGR